MISVQAKNGGLKGAISSGIQGYMNVLLRIESITKSGGTLSTTSKIWIMLEHHDISTKTWLQTFPYILHISGLECVTKCALFWHFCPHKKENQIRSPKETTSRWTRMRKAVTRLDILLRMIYLLVALVIAVRFASPHVRRPVRRRSNCWYELMASASITTFLAYSVPRRVRRQMANC